MAHQITLYSRWFQCSDTFKCLENEVLRKNGNLITKHECVLIRIIVVAVHFLSLTTKSCLYKAWTQPNEVVDAYCVSF